MRDHLIIFDCDGVLVDSEIIASRMEAAEFTRLGYPISAEEDMRRFAGKTQKDILSIVENELGRKLPKGYEDALYRKISDAMVTDLVAIDGIHHVLSMIPEKCVASNGEVKKIANSLRITGLDIFIPPEHRFSAEMVKQGKPAPDLFFYAAEKMGRNPADCIVIEDSVTGVCAAQAAGMIAFGFTGATHIIDKNHGDLLRSAGATEIFSEMKDLLKLLYGRAVAT